VEKLHVIESWKEDSHAAATGAQKGFRRYFMVESAIVKITARFTDEGDSETFAQLRQEFRREVHVLDALAQAAIEAPVLLEFVDGTDESIIVRTTFPGSLLSEIAPLLNADVRSLITGQVLSALGELEGVGLYHADLRLWNTVWDEDQKQAHLIDHGGMSSLPEDAMWPHDAYFSLVVWLVSLWGPFDDQTGQTLPRFVGIDRAELPARVISLISGLLAHERNDHVFRDIAAEWAGLESDTREVVWPSTPIAWGWLSAIEARSIAAQIDRDAECASLRADNDALRAESYALRADRDALRADRDAVRGDRDMAMTERDVVVAERDAARAERDALGAENNALRAELERRSVGSGEADAELARVLATRSWRLTEPLRRVRSFLRRPT
jgi:tRNA A-37 threonylcarbamoyl transferase component Bud32